MIEEGTFCARDLIVLLTLLLMSPPAKKLEITEEVRKNLVKFGEIDYLQEKQSEEGIHDYI